MERLQEHQSLMFSSVADASVSDEANGPATPRNLRASAANRPLLLEPALGSTAIRAGGDLPASNAGAQGLIEDEASPVPWAIPARLDCDGQVRGFSGGGPEDRGASQPRSV
jgi:hypothetical protein